MFSLRESDVQLRRVMYSLRECLGESRKSKAKRKAKGVIQKGEM